MASPSFGCFKDLTVERSKRTTEKVIGQVHENCVPLLGSHVGIPPNFKQAFCICHGGMLCMPYRPYQRPQSDHLSRCSVCSQGTAWQSEVNLRNFRNKDMISSTCQTCIAKPDGYFTPQQQLTTPHGFP